MSIPVGHWVETEHEAQKWLQYFIAAAKSGALGVDTETTGLNIVSDSVVVWSISDGKERICLPSRFLGMFKSPILENPTVQLDGTNMKFDAHMLYNSGVDISKAGDWHDTIPQSWLLNENNLGRHGLKECIVDHFGRSTPTFEATFGKVPPKKTDKVTGQIISKTVGDIIKEVFADPVRALSASDYASLDAYNSTMLRRYLDEQLEKIPTGYGTLKDLYYSVDSRFTKVLWKMERRGITADGGYFRSLQGPMEREMADIEREFAREATQLSGQPLVLNLNSVNDVRTFFYELLRKPMEKMTDGGQTGNKQPSTDKEVLDDWAGKGDPWARLLLRYREITKTYGTYVVGLQKWIDNQSRIHTTFKQTGAVTGRLSSAEPNLQNIPAPDEDPFKIREGFVPGEYKRLVVADYEQLEMRLTAIFSGDQKMIDAINNGTDIHCLTVSETQGVPYEEVIAAKDAEKLVKKGKLASLTPRQKELLIKRQSAKRAGFGILYGIGGPKLAADLTKETGRFMSEEEGRGIIDQWLNVFPGIRDHIALTKKQVWSHGCVQTVTGRYRRFGDLRDMSKRDRAEAERQSFNSIIQGSAADLAKIAMINMDSDPEMAKLGYTMLLQVHDEIVGECPDDEEIVDKVKARKKELMETALGQKLAVPLSCSVGSGYSWATAK